MVPLVAALFCLPVLLLTLAAVRGHANPSSRFRNAGFLMIAESMAAWFLGLVFFSGGMSKLIPFPGVMGPVWLEQALEPHGLALFGRFIAWSEVVIGLLLLAKPTRVAGAIMMVPLLSNILMVTASMEWRGTPWVVACFLVVNLFLLAFHYPRWQTVFRNVAVHYRNRGTDRFTNSVAATYGCLAAICVAPALRVLSPRACWILIGLALAGLLASELVLRYTTPPGSGKTAAS